jgi:hypothetical protein
VTLGAFWEDQISCRGGLSLRGPQAPTCATRISTSPQAPNFVNSSIRQWGYIGADSSQIRDRLDELTKLDSEDFFSFFHKRFNILHTAHTPEFRQLMKFDEMTEFLRHGSPAPDVDGRLPPSARCLDFFHNDNSAVGELLNDRVPATLELVHNEAGVAIGQLRGACNAKALRKYYGRRTLGCERKRNFDCPRRDRIRCLMTIFRFEAMDWLTPRCWSTGASPSRQSCQSAKPSGCS